MLVMPKVGEIDHNALCIVKNILLTICLFCLLFVLVCIGHIV
ncbi:hypothetical protein AN391_00994 [Pseudoalteromonas sp. P1-13-1a]|nr:hypothetical protein AN391_00994 [Pseudoalteromonas sp. P1-13-1a]